MAGRRGRRPLVVETHLDAFFWILRTGDPWRELPGRFGKWQTVYSQFRRWSRCGLWKALLQWFATRATGRLCFVDGTYIKLHQHGLQGAATGRTLEAIGLSRGGWTTKVVAAADEAGRLCGLILAPGNYLDQTAARGLLPALAGSHFVGDKGFDSEAFRTALLEAGLAGLTIPRRGYQTIAEQPAPFHAPLPPAAQDRKSPPTAQTPQTPRSAGRQDRLFLYGLARLCRSP